MKVIPLFALLFVLLFLSVPVSAATINPSVESQPWYCRASITKWICTIGGGAGTQGPQGLPGTGNNTYFYNTTSNETTIYNNITFFENTTIGNNLTTISNFTYFTLVNITYSEMNQTPGPQGPQGIQGIQGEIGPEGPMNQTPNMTANMTMNMTANMTAGPQGDKGDKGDQGDTGPAGPAGADGAANMTAGPQGPQGEQGLQGIQGIQGIQGVNGTPGIDGAPGADGTSAYVYGNASEVLYNIGGNATTSPCMTFDNATGKLTACSFAGDGTDITNVTASAIALSFNVREGGVGNIYKGQAVYISGSTGVNVRVLPADNTATDSSRVVGLMVQNVGLNGAGQVRRAGELADVDTRSTNANVNPLGQTWAAGDLLFATTGGGLTNVRPTSGRSVKVAYSLRGSHISDTLLAYPLENPVWVTAASNEGVVLRLGDNAGVNKVSIRNYSNNEVASFNSLGELSYNGSVNMSAIYPVGSVYITVTNTSPATLLGFGTWELIAPGRVLVGANYTDSRFNESGKIGGNYSWTT